MSTLGMVAENGIVASEEVFPKGGRHDKRQHPRVQRGGARSVSSGWEEGFRQQRLPNLARIREKSASSADDFEAGKPWWIRTTDTLIKRYRSDVPPSAL